MSKKKILSVLLCFLTIASVTCVCFTGTATAKTVQSTKNLVTLTFDGTAKYGITYDRGIGPKYSVDDSGNGYLKADIGEKNGAAFFIGKDGTVGSSIKTQYSGNTEQDEAAANTLYLYPGKTYILKFDYKLLAGTSGTSKALRVRLLKNPKTPENGCELTDRASLDTVNSSPLSVTLGSSVTTLTSDQASWSTAVYKFTVNKTETAPLCLSLGCYTTGQTNIAFDNITVDSVENVTYHSSSSRLHNMTDSDNHDKPLGVVNGTAEVFNSNEEGHGNVLKLVSTDKNCRVGLDDLKIRQGYKYYISFDARTTSLLDTTLETVISRLNDAQGTRFFMTGAANCDDGIEYYIDGQKVTAENFVLSRDWKRFGIVIDTTNENFIKNSTAQVNSSNGAANLWKSNCDFMFGVAEGSKYVSRRTVYFDNIQLIETGYSFADTVPSSADGAAVSIRHEKKSFNGSDYISAGIRFRGFVQNSVKENADEIGFIVAPTPAVINDDTWYRFGSMSDSALTASAYVKGVKDVVYDNETYSDKQAYQLILTGLSTEDGSTAYSAPFSAVMYVRTGTSYTYYGLGQAAWSQVNAMYNVLNLSPEDSTTEYNAVEINGHSLTDFTVIRDYTNRSWLVQNEIDKLSAKTESLTGAPLCLKEDRLTSESTYEIIVGNTTRSVKAQSDYDPEDYEILIDGNKVYLMGGSTYAVQVAVTEFTSMLNKGSITDSDSKTGKYSYTVGNYNSQTYYRYVWGDEFDSATLDTTKWGITQMEYLGATLVANENTFAIENGVLKMKGYKENGKYIHCDAIQTGNRLRYNMGYLEMRARIPDTKGVYSSFWGNGKDVNNQGDLLEIDIFESLGAKGKQQANIHYWYADGSHTSLDGNVTDRYYQLTDGTLFDDYHTISLLWNTDSVHFYYDGIEYYSQPTDEFFVGKYINILAGFNIGWDGRTAPADDTQYPLEYHIDYIRLFQIDGQSFISSTNQTERPTSPKGESDIGVGGLLGGLYD